MCGWYYVVKWGKRDVLFLPSYGASLRNWKLIFCVIQVNVIVLLRALIYGCIFSCGFFLFRFLTLMIRMMKIMPGVTLIFTYIKRSSWLSKFKYVLTRGFGELSKLWKLFIITSFILSRHLVVRFFLRLIHMLPFIAYMPHDFIWRPFRMLFLQFLSKLLGEIYISWKWLFRSGNFSFCTHVRTNRFIVLCGWRVLCIMSINLAGLIWCSLN